MQDRFDKGLRLREEVLGENYVRNSYEKATHFSRPFQDFITESAWGNVWSRETLDRRTKSFITLSILLALRAEKEIALHVRGAINNGVNRDELMGLFIHASVYAGVPAALSGVKIADQVLKELDDNKT